MDKEEIPETIEVETREKEIQKIEETFKEVKEIHSRIRPICNIF